MSHMTQTANPVTLLASPLGEEGHEVAKGCTRVRMIMILDVDVTAEGGIIIFITLRAIPQPSGKRPVKLKNLPLLNLHTEGVSNAARRHRHLERSCVLVWGRGKMLP